MKMVCMANQSSRRERCHHWEKTRERIEVRRSMEWDAISFLGKRALLLGWGRDGMRGNVCSSSGSSRRAEMSVVEEGTFCTVEDLGRKPR
jgi:hypothetical protein